MARTDSKWQTINGGTAIQTISPTGYDVLINGTSKYLNFNTTVGSTGYGIRDNNGVMEFKNSGGSWAGIGGGGAGSGTVTGIIISSTNGLAGTSDGNSATPTLTLSTSVTGILKGNGTAISAAVVGTDYLTGASTNTITNKRNQPRVVSAASYTTDTGTSFDFSTCDDFIITAQAGALKFNNPSGSPQEGEYMVIRIKDNGTARALTYDTQFRASSDLSLPSTTVLGKTLYMRLKWNAVDTKLDLLAVLNNI